jgi:hypothetical protein
MSEELVDIFKKRVREQILLFSSVNAPPNNLNTVAEAPESAL